MKKFLSLFAFALLFASCSSDDDNGAPPAPQNPTDRIVYVADEGGFNQGNAGLTVYNTTQGTVVQNAFESANGAPLGDVLQSIYLYDGELYLTVNNSEKIEVCDPFTFERKRTVEGLDSPRYMLFLSAEKAYVTDLFADGIHVINPETGTYTDFIPTGTWLENMILHNGEVWATDAGAGGLFFVNPDTDALGTSLALSAGANTLAADAQGDVWVLCQGDFGAEFPRLFKIDGDTKTVEEVWSFGEGSGYGGTLRISPDGQQVYYLFAGDVYRMDITAEELPTAPWIAGGSRNFYGFHVNPATGEIALTDAADFQGNGTVYLYDADGTETFNFEAGIIPGFVAWGD